MGNKKLAFEFLTTQEWALEGNFLEKMVAIALREDFDKVAALEAKSGRRVSQATEIRDDVAIISVNGVISRYANLFHAVCGGVSTELLAKEINAAINEPSVKAVILNIDSPGGEASGIHELAEMIYSARGTKPIHAYVGGMGCSAAYWIASACDRVTLDATARVGSIGTVVTFEKRENTEGTKSYEFVSSQSPNKRLDIDSEQGQTAIQTQLDEMAEVFIQRVARNMGVTAEKVKSDFGQGGTLLGQTAVNKGMAHELGSLESVISSLSKAKPTKRTNGIRSESGVRSFALAFSDEQPETIINAIKEQYPDVLGMFEQHADPISATLALDLAESANMPAMARKLSSMTENDAKQFINQASSMRDVLAASGLSGSFDTLVNFLDNPARLVGMAIHEAKASSDEASDMTRHITDHTPTYQPKNNYNDIYNELNKG